MLGRAALRRPWLFAELAVGLCGHGHQAVERDPIKVARRHVRLSRELVDKPEWALVRELRGQLLPYRLGCDGETPERGETEQRLRQDLLGVSSYDDLDRFFEAAEKALGRAAES